MSKSKKKQLSLADLGILEQPPVDNTPPDGELGELAVLHANRWWIPRGELLCGAAHGNGWMGVELHELDSDPVVKTWIPIETFNAAPKEPASRVRAKLATDRAFSARMSAKYVQGTPGKVSAEIPSTPDEGDDGFTALH